MENPLKHNKVEETIKRALKFTADKLPQYRRSEEQSTNITCLLGVEGHLDPNKTAGLNEEIAKVIDSHDTTLPGPSVIRAISMKLEELGVLKK